jgi:drug/metabolite transporter (DMT)-like permease
MNHNYELSKNILKKFVDFEKQESKSSSFMKLINYFTDNRERTPRQKLFIALLANITLTLVVFFAKAITFNYPNPDVILILLYRSITILLLSLVYIKYLKLELFNIFKIETPVSFGVFNLTLISMAISVANSVMYIRIGTTNAFIGVAPVAASIISVLFLNDKFSPRHLYGFASCTIAVYLMTIGEQEGSLDSPFWFLGILWSLLSLVSRTTIIVSGKMLAGKIDSHSLVFYMGVFGTLFSLIVLLSKGYTAHEFFFIILSCLTGVCFWLGIFLQNIALKLNSINTISFIDYLSLVYGYFLGILFFNEGIKVTDLVGCCIIIGYSIYSFLYPLHRS